VSQRQVQIITGPSSSTAWIECRTVDGQRPEDECDVPEGFEADGPWEPIGCGTNLHGGGYLVTVTVWRMPVARVRE